MQRVAYNVLMLEVFKNRLVTEGKLDLMVRVRPHAARSQFIDVLDDGSLKIDIAAPAEEGKGNVALSKFLGELFDVPASKVKILSGKGARLKLVRITKGIITNRQ